MNETMNFRVLKRGTDEESNYRLLGAPAELTIKTYEPYVRPDGDGYEIVGMCATPTIETVEERMAKREVRMRLGRKQRSARVVRPKESIQLVNMTPAAVPEVVAVRLRGGTEREEKIAALEAQIKALTAEMRKPFEAKRRVEVGAKAFAELFNEKGHTR
jgi:hypothetical protein